MDYAEALAYLTGHERLGIKFGLENIGRLVASLGHPERGFRSILVAGTNGKGSTVALIESILRASGARTGRYTSPHLVRLEERMMAMGRHITPQELASVVEVVASHAARLRGEGELLTEPTFFEMTTACAFEFFRRRGVELAVLEVGMGGRWDATNIAPADLTAITQIGLDHERFLGSTLTAIAGEKAATIKAARPVVVGPIANEPLEVIRAEAERRRSPLFETGKEIRLRVQEIDEGQCVSLESPERVYEEVFLPLAGVHQAENLAVAVRVAELTLSTSEEAVVSGVGSTLWEGRLETVAERPELLIDAAHNPQGAAALARYLEDHPHRDRVLLFGVMKDKEEGAILEPLLPHVRAMVATLPPNRRAKDPDLIVRWALERGFPAESMECPARALARARTLAGEKGQVLVAGTTFLAGEVKRLSLEEKETRLLSTCGQL